MVRATPFPGQNGPTFLDLLPVGTLLTHDRVMVNVNLAFEKMFGYTADQMIGRSLAMLYPSHREFVDRGEQWREFLAGYGAHGDEHIMLARGDRPIRMRVKGKCRDQADPYRVVACTFEALEARPTEKLSDREQSIVAGMADGKTSKEIARMLGLSYRTVETYRERMMRRVGARNATQLLALLVH